METRVTVYCAASTNVRQVFKDAADELGRKMAENNLSLVYGGGNVGLMKIVADSVIGNNGKTYGIIPGFMKNLELQHLGLTKLEIVPDMHFRQRRMMEMADFIITLPGGTGTFTEFFEAVSWRWLGLIMSPIMILNIDGYYDSMIEMMKKSEAEGFIRGRSWIEIDSVGEAIDFIIKNRIAKIKKFNFESFSL